MELTVEKVSIFGVFMVRIFPHSDLIGKDTPYLSTFSRNVAKYGPEKFPIRPLFTLWLSN